MAACAQQAFTAAVIEKEGRGGGRGKKKGERISIKIYKFIAETVIYFSVFSCLGGSASLTCQRHRESGVEICAAGRGAARALRIPPPPRAGNVQNK